MEAAYRGVMAPEETEARRASMDLGLRAALLHYSDLSVPGIAGAFFVRQLVWPCLAIALKERQAGRHLRISTARLATAIEALACKLWFEKTSDLDDADRGGRVSGVRSLPSKGWSFEELGPPHGHVSNPLRRPATRALPDGIGLGFATGGVQLERMTLTRSGEDLVVPLLNEPVHRATKLEGWLVAWVDGKAATTEKARQRLYTLLSPHDPGRREAGRVRAALLQGEDGRRARLIDRFDSIGREVTRADVRSKVLKQLPAEHAAQIEAAWLFRKLLTAAQDLVRLTASTLTAPGVKRQLSGLASNECADGLAGLRERAQGFLDHVASDPALSHADAVAFAGSLVVGTAQDALAAVIGRSERLLARSGDAVTRGPAFTDLWARTPAADDLQADGSLPPRFAQLASLLQDCEAAR